MAELGIEPSLRLSSLFLKSWGWSPPGGVRGLYQAVTGLRGTEVGERHSGVTASKSKTLEWWEIADRNQQKEGLYSRARGPPGAPRGKSLQSREILRSKAGQER